MSNIPRGPFMQAMEKYTKSIKAFISAQGFGHYSKPNGGIPKTDLDQSVQTSLGKADTALQGFTETDPTVPAWAKASSKPSYTASEVGLGNVGNFKAVSTVASQGLSDTEKANARTNIGGGTYSKPSGGIPKTDLASAVQTSLGKADSALQSETDPTVPAWAKAASKPSYTASEVGLGNVGNFKAVSTVASQGLSDTEKSNARANIGAGTGNGTYSKPSGGIPKTDLASAVQTSLGKADSALQSHQTIKQDGVTGATVNRFGTCSTAAATAAKTVSVTSGTFSLEAGARITVKFANANTAGTPTLNVNSKGAKNIFHKGAQITTGSNKSLLAGAVDFIYDGTQWHLIGNYIDTNITYSVATTSANGLMSSGDKTIVNKLSSTYTALTPGSSKISISHGGYIKIGKLCIINVLFTPSSDLSTYNDLLTGAPRPGVSVYVPMIAPYANDPISFAVIDDDGNIKNTRMMQGNATCYITAVYMAQ